MNHRGKASIWSFTLRRGFGPASSNHDVNSAQVGHIYSDLDKRI
jgi:hypothetical protein